MLVGCALIEFEVCPLVNWDADCVVYDELALGTMLAPFGLPEHPASAANAKTIAVE